MNGLLFLLAPMDFILHTASEGRSGLALAEQHQPDLAMVDVSMPGMTGWEVAERLRAMPGLEKLKVVIVSANAACTATNVTLGTPVTADNCSVASVISNAPAVYLLGTNFITWTVIDGSGNSNACTQLVIVRDTTNPVITCPANIVVSMDAGSCSKSNVTFTPTLDLNCLDTSVACQPPSGSAFPAGVTSVMSGFPVPHPISVFPLSSRCA
jgi:CheY-like chemotaxis protein